MTIKEKTKIICLCKPNACQWRMVTVMDHLVLLGSLFHLPFVSPLHTQCIKGSSEYSADVVRFCALSLAPTKLPEITNRPETLGMVVRVYAVGTCAVCTTELSWSCALGSWAKLIVMEEQVYSISFSMVSDSWIL